MCEACLDGSVVAVMAASRLRAEIVAGSLERRGLQPIVVLDGTDGVNAADSVLVLEPVSPQAWRVASDLRRDRGARVVTVGGATAQAARSRFADWTTALPADTQVTDLVTALRHPGNGRAAARPAVAAQVGTVLSSRELEVLAGMAGGSTNAEIAASLSLSPHTVRTHVRNLMRKLGASSRTTAVTMGRRSQLL